jgi:hypothetical protein
MRSKKNKPVKLKFIKPLILFFSLVLGGLLLVVLFSPSVFNPNQSFSWLVVDKEGNLVIVSHPDLDLKGTLVIVPPNTKFLAARNLGQYPASSLYQLGKQQGIGGGQLVKETLMINLSVPIDAYLYSQDLLYLDNQLTIGRQLKIKLLQSVFRPWSTDLSLTDRLKLLWFFSNRSLLEWETVHLDDYSHPDQEEADYQLLNETSLKDLFISSFTDRQITEKSLSVGIINLGDCDQAANRASQLIENMGANAILWRDYTGQSDQNQLFIRSIDLKNLNSVSRLARIFRVTKPAVKEISDRIDLLLVLSSSYCHLPK